MLQLDFVHTTYKTYGYFVRVTTTCREASGAVTTFTTCRAICYLEGQSSHNVAAQRRAGGRRSEVVGRPLRAVGTTWRSWSWSGTGWMRWWRH